MLLAAMLSFNSCSDYLDADVMDGQKTIEQVFSEESDALGALAEAYSYIQNETNWADTAPWTAISDELRVTFTGGNGDTHEVNMGAMKANSPYFDKWGGYYKGVRNATYFILHADEITMEDRNKQGTETNEARRERYRYEARACRAFYYFCLFKQYGPLVILPTDYLIESDATLDEMSIPRSSVSETVKFIEDELDACINSGKLPQSRANQQSSDNYGRWNATACMAVKSRLLLYAASDFYNADRTLDIYADFKNKDGKKLFDYTDAGRVERWQKAAKAAKDLMDLEIFELYREAGDNSNLAAYNSYRNLFQAEWNAENIFARRSGSWNTYDRCATPYAVNATDCWGGYSPTQQVVDAYFTKNGLLIDEDPAYTESGFSAAGNADYGYGAQTFNMYVDREPRFYASIAFDNRQWIATSWTNTVRFYAGGNAGWYQGRERNISMTGYLPIKFLSPAYNGASSAASSPVRNYMYFRYGEVLLNYAEALNEVNFDANKTEILGAINQIRDRAGLPAYGDGAGQIPANQERMRTLIRAERRVELAFEGHRYFDCKRWLISEQTDGGPFWGMNIYKGKDTGFFERYNFETRSFLPKNYLWPINLNETYKNKNLVQNPGW